MVTLADLLAASQAQQLPSEEPSTLDRVLGNLRRTDPLAGLMQPQAPQTAAAGAAPIGPTGGTSRWEQAARRMAAQQGWTGRDWRAIDSIIERESGWNPGAVNPSSGAYGIPQILPAAHPQAGLQGDPRGQIRWLLDYIRQRYGTPAKALAFKNAHGWY